MPAVAAKPGKNKGRRTRGPVKPWTPPVELAKSYWTRREAMEQLGCSERHLDMQIKAGLISTTKFNGCHTLVSKSSLKQYIAERTGDGLPPAEVKRRAKRA
jgi:excisionase family DNA binding protein